MPASVFARTTTVPPAPPPPGASPGLPAELQTVGTVCEDLTTAGDLIREQRARGRRPATTARGGVVAITRAAATTEEQPSVGIVSDGTTTTTAGFASAVAGPYRIARTHHQCVLIGSRERVTTAAAARRRRQRIAIRRKGRDRASRPARRSRRRP